MSRLLWAILFCVLAVSGASAQTLCNSASGFIQSDGPFTTGDPVIFGPDCTHIQDAANGIGAVTLFASAAGNDNNNCLSAATACTLSHVCLMSVSVQASTGNPLTIQIVDGAPITGPVDAFNQLCSIVGNQGGQSTRLVKIQGNCSTPANTTLAIPNNVSGIFAHDYGSLTIQCLTLTGGNNSTGVSATQFAIIDVNPNNVVFGAFGTNSAHMSVGVKSVINAGGYSITGSATNHITVGNSGIFVGTGAVTIPSALAFSTFITSQGGYMNIALMTFSGAGVAGTTGQKYVMQDCATIQASGGGDPNSVLPGNANGVVQFVTCIAAFGPWAVFTPSPVCGNATFVLNSARSKTIDKTTFIEIDYTITVLGTCTNVTTFTLPNTAASPGLIPGREITNLNTATGCRVQTGSNSAQCVKTGNIVYAVNDEVVASGVYENQ